MQSQEEKLTPKIQFHEETPTFKEFQDLLNDSEDDIVTTQEIPMGIFTEEKVSMHMALSEIPEAKIFSTNRKKVPVLRLGVNSEYGVGTEQRVHQINGTTPV